MKRSFKLLFSLLLCLLLTSGAAAQEASPFPADPQQPTGPLLMAEPLKGETVYPEGAGLEDASYLFRYSFPQFIAESEADQAINAYFQAVAQDMKSEMEASLTDDAQTLDMMGGSPALTELDFEVMLNDAHYLSVVQSARELSGNTESDSIFATTFARDGLYEGQPITLSQVLGLEQEGDELTNAEGIAQKLAYKLVWEIVQRDSENIEADYLDGLSEETLRQAFDPETDFYMDADGNIVFFIQSGTIAGNIAGILTYPFAPAEILSVVKE